MISSNEFAIEMGPDLHFIYLQLIIFHNLFVLKIFKKKFQTI